MYIPAASWQPEAELPSNSTRLQTNITAHATNNPQAATDDGWSRSDIGSIAFGMFGAFIAVGSFILVLYQCRYARRSSQVHEPRADAPETSTMAVQPRRPAAPFPITPPPPLPNLPIMVFNILVTNTRRTTEMEPRVQEV